jgi:YYY domain-containing protein
MLDWLFWLLTLEIVGLAALPLCGFLFRSLPDRGYGLAKPLGILLVMFVNWWLGSLVGLGNYGVVLWLLVLLLAVGGLALYSAGLARVPDDLQSLRLTILIEEAIFLAAFLGWTWVRSSNPDLLPVGGINSTEKPMDFMLLMANSLSHGFPASDAWLSGYKVSYYYLGYAIYAMLGHLSGVDPRYGFSLSNITVFALGCMGGYSLAYALIRRRLWALGGTFALMLGGDLDGTAQVFGQLGSGGFNGSGLNLWCSTRILDGGCANYHVITEFPIFSLIWNDLHPHVMAIPFALLALGLALQGVFDRQDGVEPPVAWYTRLALMAILLGALYPINSWDFPTYLVLALAGHAAGLYRARTLDRRRLIDLVAVAPAAIVVYLPYYLTVHVGRGIAIAFAAHPTDLGDMLTVLGGLFIPVSIFVFWRGWAALAFEASRGPGPGSLLSALQQLPAGSGWWLVGAYAFLVVALPAKTDILLVGLIAILIYALSLRLPSGDAVEIAALGLALMGVTLILLSDYVYLPDLFDGSPNYRMNTVFKLYYQAWIILSVVAPYGIYAIAQALRGTQRWLYRGWLVCIVCWVVALGVYPIEGAQSQGSTQAAGPGLDSLAYLERVDPADYATIEWIKAHTATTAVIAEADGTALSTNATYSGCTEYWVCSPLVASARISALTGRPTVIGWSPSHEALWRGAYGAGQAALNEEQLLQQRRTDVETLYTTTSLQQAETIIRTYHIAYIYVGPLEQIAYGASKPTAPGLTKFSAFLTTAFSTQGAVLYAVPQSMQG